MPIYDFRCRECGEVSEIFVRSAEQAVSCSHCGSGNLERLISSSFLVRTGNPAPGTTCCGRSERCDAPPCSTGDACRRK